MSDQHHGTPCEQIRHQHETEALTAENAALQERVDLADERERRLVEALRDRDGGTHDQDCKALRMPPLGCNCGHDALVATLKELGL